MTCIPTCCMMKRCNATVVHTGTSVTMITKSTTVGKKHRVRHKQSPPHASSCQHSSPRCQTILFCPRLLFFSQTTFSCKPCRVPSTGMAHWQAIHQAKEASSHFKQTWSQAWKTLHAGECAASALPCIVTQLSATQGAMLKSA